MPFKFMGICILLLVYVGIFIVTVLDIGIKGAVLVWGSSLLITAIIALGVYLIYT